ncbi:hypothetical protein D3C80_2043310 [compost metagenome]
MLIIIQIDKAFFRFTRQPLIALNQPFRVGGDLEKGAAGGSDPAQHKKITAGIADIY